jgi:hypothetical protein
MVDRIYNLQQKYTYILKYSIKVRDGFLGRSNFSPPKAFINKHKRYRMKTLFPKTLLALLLAVLVYGCDWSDCELPPANEPSTTLSIHVTTNIGGPMTGPLEGAPIDIVRADGSVATRGVSNKNGDVVFTLDPGTYIVSPQEVPGHEDFYEPPEDQSVTLKADEKQALTLHYDNPIL